MKNILNILKVSSVLMALTLCIGVSYPLFAQAGEVSNPVTVQNVLPIADLGTINGSNPFDSLPSYFIVYLSNGTHENWNVGSWTSSPTFNGNINGTYTFTTTLTEPADSAVTSPPSSPLTGSINFIVTGNAPADSSVPAASGQGVGGADTNGNSSDSSVPAASGQGVGGADTASSDTTPPVISAMDNISTSTDGTSVIVNYTPPSANDAVDGSITSVCVPPSGSSFPIGTTPVICTATDAAHNSASTTFDVIVTAATSSSEETDLCPNIAGVQTSIPTGMITDSSGNCVAQNKGGGGSSSSSSGSSGSYSSGGSSIIPLVTLANTTAPATIINSCPLITTYMKFGGINNPTDVAKLQVFLKDSQGLDVTVNGIFDQQMENAVRAFQSKYMSQIMGPWGATQSSGYVYITTLKKVNEIACNTPLTLSPSEMAVINAYKDQQNQNGSAVGTSTNATTTPLIPLIGQNSTGAAALVATVGSFASAWNNFWGSVWKGITKIF